MPAILKTGENAGAGVVDVGFSCTRLMLKNTGSADAMVSINGFTFSVHKATEEFYQTFDVDYNKFTIVSGTVDYICIG